MPNDLLNDLKAATELELLVELTNLQRLQQTTVGQITAINQELNRRVDEATKPALPQ